MVEGNLAAIPSLAIGAAAPTTASSTRSSSSAVLSSSTRSSSSALPAVATATAGYTALGTWITALGASCAASCLPVQTDYYVRSHPPFLTVSAVPDSTPLQGCTALDTCVCTAGTIADGQACQTCALNNAEGTFGTAQLTQLATLWTRACPDLPSFLFAHAKLTLACIVWAAGVQTTCGITAVGGGAAIPPVVSSSTGRALPTLTGIPQQSYFAPSTTASSTTRGAVAQPTSGSSGTTTSGAGPAVPGPGIALSLGLGVALAAVIVWR